MAHVHCKFVNRTCTDNLCNLALVSYPTPAKTHMIRLKVCVFKLFQWYMGIVNFSMVHVQTIFATQHQLPDPHYSTETHILRLKVCVFKYLYRQCTDNATCCNQHQPPNRTPTILLRHTCFASTSKSVSL